MTTKKLPIIQLSHVHQRFTVGDENIDVLNYINFSIEESSFNIIYGASGSGKSTLLNIITGLQPPTKGTVVYGDRDIYQFTPNELAYFRANRIGVVYQQSFWIQSLNVLENISLPLYFSGFSKSEAAKMAFVALERVNMTAYAKKMPGLLSGGEQQRINMARALSNDPTVIIADEPTGNLDSANGDMIIDMLASAHKDQKRTIILVTHNMEYLPLASKLLHIKDGVIAELNHESMTSTINLLMRETQDRILRLSKRKPTGGKS